MRKHLNTLYVTSEGAYVRRDGANLVVEVESRERGRVPVHMFSGVVCFGHVMISPSAMELCAESGVRVSFLTEHGRFIARMEGPVAGNVLLRRAQYRLADDLSGHAPLVRGMLAAKVANQRTVVRRALRDHGDGAGLDDTERRLSDILRRLAAADEVDLMRGLEGEAANAYFGAFAGLIRVPEPAFRYKGRSRRPPLDPVNAVLSFLYAMLGHDCRSALEATGLDPAVGFLHRDRPGRASLALDLMEEFRPVIADRVALSLINRRQLTEADFERQESGAVRLTEAGRKTLLIAWQERKAQEITHPFLQEKMTVGFLPHIQAQLLAKHVRGELDGYPGFIWK